MTLHPSNLKSLPIKGEELAYCHVVCVYPLALGLGCSGICEDPYEFEQSRVCVLLTCSLTCASFLVDSATRCGCGIEYVYCDARLLILVNGCIHVDEQVICIDGAVLEKGFMFCSSTSLPRLVILAHVMRQWGKGGKLDCGFFYVEKRDRRESVRVVADVLEDVPPWFRGLRTSYAVFRI